MLTIRNAEPRDVATLHGLIRDLAIYEKLLDAMDASPEQLATALFCESPRVFCDIAEWTEGGTTEPAGMALWFYNFSTFRGRHGIYLEDLFVRPGMRGKGIGKALLMGLVDRCVAQNLPRLEWAVLNWNEPAINFYKSLGALPQSDWFVFRMSGNALSRR